MRASGGVVLAAVAVVMGAMTVTAHPVVVLPMLFYGTQPAVEVRVNGEGPFLFLIDTGGGGMARADASLVKRLGLPRVGQETSADASAKTQATLDEVRLDRLSIGGLEFRDVKAFSRDYNTSTYLPHIDVAGKTGTLTRYKENRFYTWFVGFAPADKPEVAIATLIVNTPNWQIKAPELARNVLRAHFAQKGAEGVTAP